jgi:hypothetical protein
VIEGWIFERRDIIRTAQQMGRPISEHEEKRLQKLHSDRVENYLDAGGGACWLRQPAIARIVADALRHFDVAWASRPQPHARQAPRGSGVPPAGNHSSSGETPELRGSSGETPELRGSSGETPRLRPRYRLHAWCIMPNHVHVVVEPFAGHELPEILHSWKSFTAKTANRLLGRTGGFWQDEYYDHLIRDTEEYFHAIGYVLENPARAGLRDWPWVWSLEVAG